MSRGAIGLDIGTSAVRAAEVKGNEPGTLTRFAQLGLSAGAVVGGEIADADAVVSSIKELWKRGRFKTKRVGVAVANASVILRQIELPRMDEADLKGALQYQVQDYIPIPMEDAYLDYLPLGEFVREDGTEMMRVLAVAAQKEMVNTFAEVLTRAGLDVVAVDISPLAAVRALVEGVPSVVEERAAEAIVDIGAGVTNVVVHENGGPTFARILASGGNEITAALVSELSLSVEDAEMQKLAVGLHEEGSVTEHGPAGVIEQRARSFIEDVERSLAYYHDQPLVAPVRRVVLTGGGSLLPMLRERLAGALRLPVEYGNALAHLQVGDVGLTDEQLAQVGVVGAVAVGMAMEP